MTKPLDGIRILEWAIWLAGPGASMMLGDMGAEVIKIEQPIVGDPSRGLRRMEGMQTGTPTSEMAYQYSIVNRNKKCIVVDVAKPEGREIVYRLVKKCDVFLQNFRGKVRDRLKLDYATLSQYNKKLIYANISAFGPDGPENWRRGNDYIGLARSGFMSFQKAIKGEPESFAGGIADHMTSIATVNGILAALLARERLGKGQEIDTSLIGSMASLLHVGLTNTFLYQKEIRRANRTAVGNPLANHYKCKDDKWIIFAIMAADAVWPDFCKAAGIQELEKDPKFETSAKRAENSRELIGLLDKLFATKTRDEWVELMNKYPKIMFAPVNEGIDVANDPQMIANKYVVEYEQPPYGKVKAIGCPVKFHATPAGVQGPSPEFGQHTEEVLIELGGYSWDEISQLRDKGAIG